MTEWTWRHAENRTHYGWIPQVNLVVLDGRPHEETLTAEPTLVVGTQREARQQNREIVKRYAHAHHWVPVPAENEWTREAARPSGAG